MGIIFFVYIHHALFVNTHQVCILLDRLIPSYEYSRVFHRVQSTVIGASLDASPEIGIMNPHLYGCCILVSLEPLNLLSAS